MIVKIDQKINDEGLRSYLNFVKSTCPPYMKKNGPWGGWSITSSTGEIYDGWQTGERAHQESTPIEEKEAILDFFSKTKFDTPTPIYNDFIEDLLKTLKVALPKIRLTRLRIAVLRPHPEASAYWHRDGDGGNTFRLHIPIITNENCFFEYQNERHHLCAGGTIYLVNVGRIHRALNLSNEDRYHLIADAYQI